MRGLLRPNQALTEKPERDTDSRSRAVESLSNPLSKHSPRGRWGSWKRQRHTNEVEATHQQADGGLGTYPSCVIRQLGVLSSLTSS